MRHVLRPSRPHNPGHIVRTTGRQADGDALVTDTDNSIVHRIGNGTLLYASGGRKAATNKLTRLYKDADGLFQVARSLHQR